MKIITYFLLFCFAVAGIVAGLCSKDYPIIAEYKIQIVILSVFLVVSVGIFSRITSR